MKLSAFFKQKEKRTQVSARQVEEPKPEQLPAAQQHDAPVPQHGGQGEQRQAPAAHDQVQASNTDLQTVMQECGLTLGKPCEDCGCPIERDLFGEAVLYGLRTSSPCYSRHIVPFFLQLVVPEKPFYEHHRGYDVA